LPLKSKDHSRLVYISNLALEHAIEEFESQVKFPLKLKGLTNFDIRERTSPFNTTYFQADLNHTNEKEHTYISIRSRKK
tara:strand:+ start:484 stop:720 length:237 start_codon:yes stop_codon:yes gene_type:complete